MLIEDVRHSLRSLWKGGAVTAIVIACLGLGIGINATLFAVVDGVLIQPLPFSEPDQLVIVTQTSERQGIRNTGVSYLNLRDYQAQATSFSHLAGLSYRSLAFSDRDAEPERFQGAAISWELFPMLGALPAMGRHFGPDDDRPGAEPVVIISDVVWQRRYNADPSIVGRRVTVDGQPHTVVGVMPPGFEFPEVERAWIPLAPVVHTEPRDNRSLFVIGRLKAGVDGEAANAEFAAIAARLAQAYPQANSDWGARTRSLVDDFTPSDVRLIVSTMMGAVTLVLLIACANVANLMLARASVRQREFSVRAALGAGRARMVRQLLTECIILGLASAPLGLLIAYLGVYLLDNAVPPDMIPYYIDWAIDARTIAYTTVIAGMTGVVFGLAPALQAGRLNIVEQLRDGGRGSGSSGKKARVRNGLVVVEVALALILLVGASLFVRSFLNLQGAQAMFDTAPLFTTRFFMAGETYATNDQRARRVEDIVQRVEALSGIEAAFASNFVPFDGGGGGGNAVIEGRDVPAGKEPFVAFYAVTPHIHRALGLKLRRGRDFTDAEGLSQTPVAIINQTMATKFWSESDPVGQRFRLTDPTVPHWFTIIGVVPDVRENNTADDEPPTPSAFVPYRYVATANTGLTIRTSTSNPLSAGGAVRAAIRASDPGLPIFNMRAMEENRTRQFWQYRLFGQMFGIFGVVALVLAAVGVYGVLSFAVSQRTQEIGLRVALGAQRGDVVRMVVVQGIRLAAAGVVLGLLGAFGITRVIRTLLYNVTPTDPISFGGVAVFLAVIALVASYLPARRATTVDPIVALRNE